MIYSMTGFGKGETQSDTLGINVEIRTLNSKSFDLNLRTHNSLREIEPLLRKKISKYEKNKFKEYQDPLKEYFHKLIV